MPSPDGAIYRMQLPRTVHPQSRMRGKRASQQRCNVMVTKSDRTSWWIGIERADTSRKSVGWISLDREANPSTITAGFSMDAHRDRGGHPTGWGAKRRGFGPR